MEMDKVSRTETITELVKILNGKNITVQIYSRLAVRSFQTFSPACIGLFDGELQIGEIRNRQWCRIDINTITSIQTCHGHRYIMSLSNNILVIIAHDVYLRGTK
jgi:hypothetical protein